MTTTPNLGLEKPGDNGILDIKIIDGNMDLIDGAIGNLNSGKEPTITKNTAFNKNFGTGSGEVAEGEATRQFENITRHNLTTDIPTMQDNASNYLDERLDDVTGKMYICTNETGSAAVANPTSDFEKISVWENAKKLETLSTENFKEVVLYEGTWQTTGVLTLNDNWNNYKEIVIAGYDTTYGNETHNRFRTSLITASDTSTQHQVGESCLYNFNDDYVTGYFRETNKNEINVTGRSSGTTLTKIIGIGKIG